MLVRKIIATALFVVAFAGVLYAQDRKALREACMADAKKHCTGVKPGGGRIVQCLRDHAADLTPACRDGLDAKPAR